MLKLQWIPTKVNGQCLNLSFLVIMPLIIPVDVDSRTPFMLLLSKITLAHKKITPTSVESQLG